jgi:hypothetical protein
VYLGDMHAMQGDGEIAGHTADVAGTVTLQVEVLKGLDIDGPILFPLEEDLPFLARPLTAAERDRAVALPRRNGLDGIEESLPISVIGTGPDLNSATDNGLARAAELLQMTVPEVAKPGDRLRRHRDRPPPRRSPRDLPRAGVAARRVRPAVVRRGAGHGRNAIGPAADARGCRVRGGRPGGRDEASALEAGRQLQQVSDRLVGRWVGAGG